MLPASYTFSSSLLNDLNSAKSKALFDAGLSETRKKLTLMNIVMTTNDFTDTFTIWNDGEEPHSDLNYVNDFIILFKDYLYNEIGSHRVPTITCSAHNSPFEYLCTDRECSKREMQQILCQKCKDGHNQSHELLLKSFVFPPTQWIDEIGKATSEFEERFPSNPDGSPDEEDVGNMKFNLTSKLETVDHAFSNWSNSWKTDAQYLKIMSLTYPDFIQIKTEVILNNYL